jgi:hypothetical protein
MRDMLMQISMRENLVMEKPMVKVYIPGQMVKCTMVNGSKGLKKAMGFGKVFMVILTLVNGRTLKLKDMVCTSGKMGIDTRVNGRHVLNMDRVQICLQMVTPTQANINSENQMDLASINGKMQVYMLVISKMVLNMAKENGKKLLQQTVIHMKVIIAWIKRTDMEFSHGRVVTYTRGIIKMMREKGMGRCIGQMDPYIRVNGKREFNMGMVKCCFQMDQLKRDILRIMFLRDLVR